MEMSFDPFEPSVSRIDPEMPVEVMLDFDTVLMFGRLAEASPRRLRIERVLDGMCFPVLPVDSVVLIRGYDGRMDPVLLRAVVVRSSGLRCEVESLERICHKTARQRIRYPVCPPGTVHIWDCGTPERPWPCRLINISAGGACIVSDQPYEVGQSLVIRVGTEEDGAAFRCQVVRATPRRGGLFEYGLHFVHLCLEQQERLAREIQAVREETGKKLRRRPRFPEES